MVEGVLVRGVDGRRGSRNMDRGERQRGIGLSPGRQCDEEDRGGMRPNVKRRFRVALASHQRGIRGLGEVNSPALVLEGR